MGFRGLRNKLVYLLVNHWYAGAQEKHFEKKRRLLNSVGHCIGEGTRVVGPVFATGTLVVGKNCWIGRNLCVHGNGTITIGDCCDVAPDVRFLTGGHKIGTSQRRAGVGFSRDIRVGDGCWIGAGSTVLAGVEIGKGSVVAACACVTKSVEENTLVGGVSARVIRKLENAE